MPSSARIGGQGGDEYYVLQRMAVVAGSQFRSADPSVNPDNGQRMVRFTLTNEAGEKFYEYTKANVGNPMAVVMGGTVREVANIKSPIHDQGDIEGAFSEDEVTALKLLKSGALPASLNEIETRTVGASLGADSIKEGVTAAIVGMLVVMAFMLVYYKGSGINADLALILNLIILLGFMGGVGNADAAGHRRRDPDDWYGRIRTPTSNASGKRFARARRLQRLSSRDLGMPGSRLSTPT